MGKLIKGMGLFLFSSAYFVTLVFAENFRPGRGGHQGGYSVAEPAAILLLGAGLVSLGVFARKKRNKK